MKIVYLLTRLDEIGGAQIHVRDLATALQAQGHQPVIISGTAGTLNDYFDHLGIENHTIPDLVRAIHPVRDMRAFRALSTVLADLSPDLVSCHSSKAGILGRLAAHRLGIPVVFTAHGWSFTDGVSMGARVVYRVIERLAAAWCGHIITVSDYDRDLALAAGIATPSHMTTIHNGMTDRPVSARKPSMRDGHDPDDPVRLIMVARFGAQKDHATLITALLSLKDLSFDLDLVGGGDNTDIFQAVRAGGLLEQVTFWGERMDVPDMIDESDIFILSTHWEGFPRSILEAMRAGKPVIATGIAGIPEAVTDRITGILVPRSDPAPLAAALRALITDPDARARMGRAARARFERDFTFQTMRDRTVAIYKQLVDKSGACGGKAC